MTDKYRHRHVPAPHGFLPNWVLMLLAAGATLLVLFAKAIVS